MGKNQTVKSDYDEERREAEYLAAFTDALLDGEDYDVDGEGEMNPALTQTVQILGRTLRPEPTPSRVRYRIRSNIRAQSRTEEESWWEKLQRSLAGARRRRVFIAASVLVVMAFAVTLVLSYVDLEVAGTAVGEPGAWIWALGAGVFVLIVAALLWWRSSSR